MTTHLKNCFSWGEIQRLYGSVAKPFKIPGQAGIVNVKCSFF